MTTAVSRGAAPRVVGVGSGPGWPSVVALLAGIPAASGLAFVAFSDEGADVDTRAAELGAACALDIVVATDGASLSPNRAYIVDRRFDATYADGRLHLAPAPPHATRAPVDRLFRALAEHLGAAATGVVLAGSSVDGSIGLKRIKEEGGLTAVELPTMGADVMPRAAIATGLVNLVGPVDLLAQRLVELNAVSDEPEPTEHDARSDFDTSVRDILTFVRLRSGHDFSSYKRATLHRRIARRMHVCDTGSPRAYLQYLRTNPTELAALLRDFLIGVTNFFRDTAAFAALDAHLASRFFGGKTPRVELRAWVTGCATGEEAYSVAMLLLERAALARQAPQVQVFATDIDEEALAVARAGKYPDTISLDVSPERLDRFFTKEGAHYRVKKELRERVLFSPHNVLRDPPFSRLDLITCRNVLIYLNRDAQERVLGVFQFGLRADGLLFLGSSESAETSTSSFTPLDTKHRVYARHKVVGVVVPESAGWQAAAGAPAVAEPAARPLSFGELHHQMVERYAPPSVLVNEELEVVHVSERAGRYLALGGGEPTRQILRLVHPELRLDLRTALHAARQPGHAGDKRVVELHHDGGRASKVEIEVRTADLPLASRALLLVLFREIPDGEATPPSHPTDPAIEPVVREMEDELYRTRDQLRVTVEQYETSLEELKASNEELQAINEEFRSATEELETSREELQSVNEELTTLNVELQSKVEEVSRANGDLQNLMTSTDIGVLFLDRGANIKRFTERAKDLFNVIASDVGRPFAHLTHRLETQSLPADVELVLATLRPLEREVRAVDGRRYLARILPYRSLEDRIEGVVLTFLDVSELKRAEDALRDRDAKLRLAERAADAGAWDYDAASRTFTLSDECARLFELAGRPSVPLGDLAARVRESDRSAFVDALARTADTNAELDVDVHIPVTGGGERVLFCLGRARVDGAASGVSGIVIDFTARRRTEAELRASERRFRLALRAAPVMILSQDSELRYTWGLVHGAGIDFVGRTDADVFRAEEAAALDAVKRRAVASAARQRVEIELTFEGSKRTFELIVEPIVDAGAVVGVTTVALDVTSSRAAERALREADRRKDQFLATLAHELRTPLAPIRSAIDVLRVAGAEPPRVARSLGVMDRQLTQLVRLVDDLLDVARISEGKIQLRRERARVRSLVEQAVESVKPALDQAGHTLAVDVDDELVAFVDPARVTQILGNLLTNAVKYTDPGGAVAIAARADGATVVIRVRDNGAGVEPRALPHLFDMFAQEGRVDGQGGLGIGLNLVRQLVELHGGSIDARSDGLGKGSEFIVRLPREAGGSAK